MLLTGVAYLMIDNVLFLPLSVMLNYLLSRSVNEVIHFFASLIAPVISFFRLIYCFLPSEIYKECREY